MDWRKTSSRLCLFMLYVLFKPLHILYQRHFRSIRMQGTFCGHPIRSFEGLLNGCCQLEPTAGRRSASPHVDVERVVWRGYRCLWQFTAVFILAVYVYGRDVRALLVRGGGGGGGRHVWSSRSYLGEGCCGGRFKALGGCMCSSGVKMIPEIV